MAGAVAVGSVERWTGVYNETASEPAALGHALWLLLEAMHARGDGLEELAYLMERWGRWEAIARAQGVPFVPPADRAPIRVASSVVDPRTVEWVYVVDAVARRLTVLTTVVEADPTTGATRAKHAVRAALELPPAPEPDWRALSG